MNSLYEYCRTVQSTEPVHRRGPSAQPPAPSDGKDVYAAPHRHRRTAVATTREARGPSWIDPDVGTEAEGAGAEGQAREDGACASVLLLLRLLPPVGPDGLIGFPLWLLWRAGVLLAFLTLCVL